MALGIYAQSEWEKKWLLLAERWGDEVARVSKGRIDITKRGGKATNEKRDRLFSI